MSCLCYALIFIIIKSQSQSRPFVYLSRILGHCLVPKYWKYEKYVKVLSCSILDFETKDSRSRPGLVPILIFNKSRSWTRPFVNFSVSLQNIGHRKGHTTLFYSYKQDTLYIYRFKYRYTVPLYSTCTDELYFCEHETDTGQTQTQIHCTLYI